MLIGRRVLGSWRAGTIIGVLVLSHWILDFVTHRPDLPIWPGGPQAGLGLWNSIPGTIILEGGLLAAGVWLYVRASSPRDAVGRWALIGLVGLVGIIWVTQPWSPPPPTTAAVAWGALILWLFPVWAGWIERHRLAAGSA
jgi:hypothetical protein